MTRIARQRSVSRIVAAALLFAQALLAFADCQMPARSPAAAIALGDSPCHESSGEVNLCLAHCLAADQSLDKRDITMYPLSAIPLLVVRAAAEFNYASLAPRRLGVPQAAAPPARILFRTLRI